MFCCLWFMLLGVWCCLFVVLGFCSNCWLRVLLLVWFTFTIGCDCWFVCWFCWGGGCLLVSIVLYTGWLKCFVCYSCFCVSIVVRVVCGLLLALVLGLFGCLFIGWFVLLLWLFSFDCGYCCWFVVLVVILSLLGFGWLLCLYNKFFCFVVLLFA